MGRLETTLPDHEVKTKLPEAPYYVKALAMGIPAILLGLQLSGWIFIFPAIINGHSDFRQLYTSGYMVRTGHRYSLYDYAAQIGFQNSLVSPEQIALPFNHLAYESLLFVPFSFLPYRAAFASFLAGNLLLLGLSLRLLRCRLDRVARIYRWLPAALFVSFIPVAAALMQGQDSIILLTLLAGAIYLLDQKRDLAAGILTGLGMFKFTIVVPIGVLFLLWRRWRFSLGFACSVAATVCASLWLTGRSQCLLYVRSLISMGVSSTIIDQIKYGINPIQMANLRGLVAGVAGPLLPHFWIQFITISISLAALLWAAVRGRAVKCGTDALGLAITVATAVSYHLYIHDMSVLLIPVILMLDRFIDAESTGDSSGRSATRGSVVMFAAPAFMSVAPLHFYLVSVPLLAFLYLQVRSGGKDSMCP